jgi:hypothetical protein
MKRRVIAAVTLAVAAVFTITSCSLLGLGQRDEIYASLAAGALLEYVAAEGYEQVQELDVAAETYDLAAGGPAQSARTVSTEVITHEYPNVTLTITREVDDMDTPDDPTDDVMTVIREADYGFEANRIHVLVRPLRPTTDTAWDSYNEGTEGWVVDPLNYIVQEGTITNSLDLVEYSNGTVLATWKRDVDTIYAEQIVKEISNLVHPEVVRRTTLTQTPEGETSLLRERLVDGELIHSYTVEPWVDPDDGLTYARIVRDDGSYGVVRARGNRAGDPRVVDYYTSEDVLVMTVEDVAIAARGTVTSTRTFYDEDGNITGTRTATFSINYMEGDEDQVQITRTVNGRTRVVTITESGEVYVVVIDGETYTMEAVDVDTVHFLDDAGNVIMTAQLTPEGNWQLTRGDEVIII